MKAYSEAMNELIVNLWAFYDADAGVVYALSGKAYSTSGEDSLKLDILKSLARTDYVTAKRYDVPSRFQVCFTDGTAKKNVTYLNAITDPNANLFEEMFRNIEAELPPLIRFSNGDLVKRTQKLPKNPLCVVTTLYENEHGNITPVVTASDREWVRQQEAMRGR